MKFKTTITVASNPSALFRLITEPRNLAKWQNGFQQYKPKKGKRRAPGDTGVQIFRDGEQQTEVREEVLSHQSAQLFAVRLQHRNMDSTVQYELLDQGGNKTQLIVLTKVRLKPLFFNILSLFVKGPMRKQAREDLLRLKELAERG